MYLLTDISVPLTLSIVCHKMIYLFHISKYNRITLLGMVSLLKYTVIRHQQN